MGSGKGVEGSTKCIKYLVLFFNFLFFLLGLALLGIGIWAEVKLKDYFDLNVLDGYGIDSGPRIIIAVGCIITVVAFFGCCGAWMENKVMLIIFFVLMLLLFCLEIAAAVLAFVKKDEVKDELQKELEKKIKDYDAATESKSKDINDLQKTLDCCGATGYMDWGKNTAMKATNSVPDSCCVDPSKTGCGKGKLIANPGSTIHKKGCYTVVKDQVEDNLVAVGAVAITILVLQLLGMIFAVVLIYRIGSATLA